VQMYKIFCLYHNNNFLFFEMLKLGAFLLIFVLIDLLP